MVEPTPSVAVLVPSAPPHRDVATALLSTLGLPQVAVICAGEPVPSSVHTVVSLGPPGWSAPAPDTLPHWRLTEPEGQGASCASFDTRAARPIPFDEISWTSAPSCAPGASTHHLAERALYFVLRRLQKREGFADDLIHQWLRAPLSVGEPVRQRIFGRRPASASDALVVRERFGLELLLFALTSAKREHLAILTTALLNRAPARRRNRIARTFRALSERGSPDAASVLAHLRTSIREQLPAALATVAHFEPSNPPPRAHDLLAAIAVEAPEPLMQWATVLPTATEVASVGVAGFALRADDLVRRCRERLFDDFLHTDLGAFRNDASGAFCHSPALAAFLVLLDDSHEPLLPLRETVHASVWHAVPGATTDRTAENLYDANRRLISRSLLDNWVTSQQPPDLGARQLEIGPSQFTPRAAALEHVWRQVFGLMHEQAGVPMVRVVPWPAPHSGGLSLRFDVDRPITNADAERLVAIQHDGLGANAGSWYFLPTTHNAELAVALEARGQEVGHHVLSANGSFAGRGVTFHNGVDSTYWRGTSSLLGLEANGARYGEHLATQLGCPRRVLIDGVRMRMPALPLHFPLEGTRADPNLAFFERQLDELARLRELGGHLIIGTHPDLCERSLPALLARNELANLWPATVAGAVERCELTLEYGALSCAHDVNAGLSLTARASVTALQIEIWYRGERRQLTLDLAPGVPTRLP